MEARGLESRGGSLQRKRKQSTRVVSYVLHKETPYCISKNKALSKPLRINTIMGFNHGDFLGYISYTHAVFLEKIAQPIPVLSLSTLPTPTLCFTKFPVCFTFQKFGIVI